MEHPIRLAESKSLRIKVLHLIQNGFGIPRASNIVFVCGGNEPEKLRPQFIEYCTSNNHPFVLFQPEFAMSNLFSHAGADPFNIAEFETIVGDLSLAIVVFPEAPGSFAETGYFSAIDILASKTILVMDADRQKQDSFLSIGPAKLIGEKSFFHPIIQGNYLNPDFSIILNRIATRHKDLKLRHLEVTKFSLLSNYELLQLIYIIVDMLGEVTIEDITFVLNGLFKGRAIKKRIWLITSVLAGAGFLVDVGDYGQMTVPPGRSLGAKPREGFSSAYNALKMEARLLSNGFGPETYASMESA